MTASPPCLTARSLSLALAPLKATDGLVELKNFLLRVSMTKMVSITYFLNRFILIDILRDFFNDKGRAARDTVNIMHDVGVLNEI